MFKNKRFISILLIIEVQIILLMMFYFLFRVSELETKLKRTNIFIYEIFQNKQLDNIQITDDTDIIIGQQNAPATIIMYSKFDCSVCDMFFTTNFNKIKTNYIDKGIVKLVIRYLCSNNNKKAFYYAKSAQYAYKNDVFEAFNNKILNYNYFETDTTFVKEIINSLAPDTSSFNEYITNSQVGDLILQKATMARKLGINRTPCFIINGQILAGNRRYEKIEELIISEIESKISN